MKNKYLKMYQPASLLLISFFLLAFGQPVSAQADRTIRGTVYDTQQEGLPGVNVVQKGTINGTVTNYNGEFTLTIPAGAQTLVFSFVGLITQEIEVTNETSITVVMEESFSELDEVVVIGYGTARRSDVTGSISSIGEKAIREIPATNISQALQGRVAGVDFTQTSSRPGSEMQIRIRGARSLTASNDPLIVLDGIPFPGSLSDINPTEIKSIDILKDASSTAIYGSRGANGVIMVTTNKRDLGKPSISYNGYYGITSMFSRYPMMSGPEFVAFREEAAKNGSAWATMSADDDPTVDTDWQDLVLDNGYTTSHNLSISAPTKGGYYNFGVGYHKDEGIAPLQGYERISARASIDQEVAKIIRVGMTTQNSFAKTTGEQTSIIEKLLSTNPTISPYDSNGNPLDEVFSMNSSDRTWNPLFYKWVNGQKVDEKRTFASYNTLYGEVKLYFDGLKYRVNVGANYRQYNTGLFTGTTGPWSGSTNVDVPVISNAEISNVHTFNWVVENLLTYDKTFGKHSINAVAMYSAEETTYRKSQASAQNITVDAVQFHNLGLRTGDLTMSDDDQDYWERGLISYMGRVAYQYDNRYMLSATIRSDGASVLAEGHKWHTYPAVSAGWNMGNESFMRNISWLNFLKLRVGYGQTSNQSIDPYQTYGMMASARYNYGSNPVTGYYPNTVPNENLGWEYSETWNFGLDFGLFNGRLSGTAEYYIQDTEDLLMSLTLPASSGINGSYMTNIGATQNKGFELTLNGRIIDNLNGWTWDLGVNFYTNKNKIKKLASESKNDRNVANMWFRGHSINSIYDYKKTGIFQTGEEAVAAATVNGGKPGVIKVAYNMNEEEGDPVTFDANGIPSRLINGNDRQIIGSLDADFQGGFNTTVAYKNFDLSVIGMFRSGGILISTLHAPQGYLNMLSGRRNNVDVDYWTETNPTNKYPMPGGPTGSQDAPMYGTTLSYFDADYLKIRTITLGYNFSGDWMSAIGLSNGRVYFTCSNPFVIASSFHKETGLDPETNTPIRENTAARNDDMPTRLLSVGTNTPSIRSFIFGLNLTF